MELIQSLTAVLFLLFNLCAGERMVSIQKGRLYRARGYHITIWCNVSGYQGPKEQNFEWSIYLPSHPTREMQIVSTADSSFTYAMYSESVTSERIYIERLQGDSVLLHITELQDRDAGEYECYTPSTDRGYLGTYSAKMHLTVIPDTLSATMKPQVLRQNEGDSVELICEVLAATAQHTHLSVAWYLLKEDGDGQVQMILSLSRDFALIPGSSYLERFSLGDIRLDKIGSKMYRLSIIKIQPSDQGKVYCEAKEWIQDPDETWKDIARKETPKTSLSVRSLDKRVSAIISTAESSLLDGETLQINCSVQAQRTQHRWFQVVWLHDDLVVASIDQYGVLSYQKDNVDRNNQEEKLRVKKQSNNMYILQINQVELKDKGTYKCEVSEIEKTPTGSFIKEKIASSDIHVNVKPRESPLKLSVWVSKKQIMEGEALVFHCNVSVTENALSVNWWHIPKGRVLIAGMDQDGRLNIGSSYLERRGDIRLEKVLSSTFVLTIYNTSARQDTGLYHCEMTEWSKGRSWKHTQEISTTVKPWGLTLKAVLSSRTASVQLHEDVHLFCMLSANYNISELPLSITWQFQPSSKLGPYQQVVKVTAGGNIEWGSAYLHFQKKTMITKSFSGSQLLIYSATWQEAGVYRCKAEIGRISQHFRNPMIVAAAVESSSNAVEIKVTQPGNKPHIEKANHSITVTEDENVTLECNLQSPGQCTSRYSVTWFKMSNNSGTDTLVKMRENGVIEYGNGPMLMRLHPHCPSEGAFRLTLWNVELVDAGLFYCEVEEWDVPNCRSASLALEQSGYSRLLVLPKESTSSGQICSSPSTFYSIVFYPLVLFPILTAVLIYLCFKTKLIHKKKRNVEKKKMKVSTSSL